MQKFDSNGNFIRTWGSLGAGEGQFKTARNITVGPDQTIYVSNGGSSASEATADVQRFTRDGTFLGRWGNFGEAPGQFMTILGLETDASGVVYVVDHHNFRIQNFTASGGFICAWAQRGPRGPNGNLEAPHDIAIDDDGDIFIVDITNDGAIQHFSYTVSLQHTSWSSVKSLFVPPTDPSDP